jgi:spermidine synthase
MRPPGALTLGPAVFVCGAVLLAVELAASRILAPFFGNSLFVWGALIGVVLTGLAAGYWLGGTLGDRLPTPRLLAAVIGAAGLAVLALPFADEAVLRAIVAWDPGPRADPLLAALALFLAPSVLLAAVVPIAVRLHAHGVGTVGRTAGRLFSISTAGSIAGTFATAFWLVPEIGTDQLLAVCAVALFAAAWLVALAGGIGAVPVAIGAALVAASVAVAAADVPARENGAEASLRNWSPVYRLRGYSYLDARDPAATRDQDLRVVYRKDTQYHRLAVVDDDTTRYLRFDNSLQSAMYLDDPLRTRFRYTDYFHLGLAYNPRATRVLFIGLGAGSTEKLMWRSFADVRLQVVEIDPVVVDVAHRYFGVPRDPRLRIAVDDGRRYLARHSDRWDVIVIDAFYADSIPFHLVTREFLQLARSRLARGGVVVTNVIGALDGPGSRLFRSVYRTYRAAFPTVVVHPVFLPEEARDATAYRNIILVATEQAAPEPSFLAARWERLRRAAPRAPDLRTGILDRHDAVISVADVPLLTDDYAPTDALLALFQ